MNEVVFGVGPAGFGADVVVPLAPQHPGAHGALRLAVRLSGERIVQAEPVIGFMHRGAEKLFEVRDYRQIIVLTNRHDWLSAFGNELGLVRAVERMAGLPVPERASWLRTALAELNRVCHHLAFLAGLAAQIGEASAGSAANRAREMTLEVFESAAGGRVHYMFNRIGGLLQDVPAGWSARLHEVLAEVARVTEGELAAMIGSPRLRAAASGVAVLDRAVAAAYGVSGPPARASGLAVDLRRSDPDLGYADLDLRVITRTGGDSLARFQCLWAEVPESLRLITAALDRADTAGGPVNVRLPKVLRPPEGQIYTWTENPAGINGYFLVSRGGPTPWRLKIRTASFANVQALREMLPGTRVQDLPIALSSLFFVSGDIDR